MALNATHLRFDLVLDFGEHIVRGWVEHELERAAKDDETFVVQTRGLDIEAIRSGHDSREFEMAEPNPIDGSDLRIRLRQGDRHIKIEYRSRPDAWGLQWLSPGQTAGGKQPFVYSQGETNHNRSWLPCQDDPAFRATFDATLRVPAGMRAVMAAEDRSSATEERVFRYHMPQSVPAYLIALAAGDLRFRPMSERTGVWAEPNVVDLAAWEFADTEAMMQATEELYGPYRWGRYDLLVLPPSFPLGGMENPRLTFATPTVLAGDRSLVSLVAHELAHSWSGNLVTNATWDDFWLNEGFTVYLERRVIEAIFGRERSEMEASIGRSRLQAELARLGEGSRDSWLKGKLAGRAPDDSFSEIPYEKGYLFLRHLEENFGRKRFDEFLRAYFDRHAFETMDTERFVVYLREELFSLDTGAAARIDPDAWIYAPDLPPEAPRAQSTAFASVEAYIVRLREGADIASATNAWCSQEWVFFLRHLPRPLEASTLSALGETLGLDAKTNADIRCEWLRLCVESGRGGIEEPLRAYLGSVGRKRFLQPIYDAMWAREEFRFLAREIYAMARPMYHVFVRKILDEKLG